MRGKLTVNISQCKVFILAKPAADIEVLAER